MHRSFLKIFFVLLFALNIDHSFAQEGSPDALGIVGTVGHHASVRSTDADKDFYEALVYGGGLIWGPWEAGALISEQEAATAAVDPSSIKDTMIYLARRWGLTPHVYLLTETNYYMAGDGVDKNGFGGTVGGGFFLDVGGGLFLRTTHAVGWYFFSDSENRRYLRNTADIGYIF